MPTQTLDIYFDDDIYNIKYLFTWKKTISVQKPERTKKRIIVVTPQPRPSVKVVFKKHTELSKHQHNANTVLQCSNATPIGRYGGMGYACSYCDRQVTAPRLLKDHTLQNHTTSEKASFMSSRNLTNFIVKLDITDLRCTLCNTPFLSLDELTDHLVTNHNKTYHTDIKSHIVPFKFDSEFYCAICLTNFSNFKILLMHMNIHFRNYVCDVCGQGFVNQKVFRAHMYRHDKGVFNCSFCTKTFDNRVKCRDHERATHKVNNLRSKCGYCGERFTDYTKKNDHVVKVHGVKPLVLSCWACSKTFDNQRALTAHTKNHHLLEKRLRK